MTIPEKSQSCQENSPSYNLTDKIVSDTIVSIEEDVPTIFIGREKELKRLADAFASPHSEAILLYGRRRVGKSELIKEALRRSTLPKIYFQCGLAGEKKDIAYFNEAIHLGLVNDPSSFDSVEHALEYLFKLGMQQPLILALDEFPNLMEDIPGIAGQLQTLIDTYQGKTQLKLILSGSYLSAMKALIGPEGQLYKRETFTLLLRPMTYQDAGLFFPKRSPKEKALAYAVFGGLPYCLAAAAKEPSLKLAVIASILTPGAVLGDFSDFVTSKELKKLKGAPEVFSAIAAGSTTFSALQDATSLKDPTALSRVLVALVGMDLIAKLSPINDKMNKRKTFYRIKDRYLLFYYTDIAPHLSALGMMDEATFYETYIAPNVETSFAASAFEEITSQYLVSRNRQKALPELYEDIGTYWYDDKVHHRNGQFDVALRAGKHYFLVECKFTRTPITAKVIQEEEQQTQALALGQVSLGFASLSGFDLPKAIQKKYYCVSLEEMYQN